MTKFDVLKRYFGYTSFRPGQEALIDALLSGQDALGIMPTGAGKSVCYQIPAMLLPGVTLVISPLIALMKDQVTNLTERGIQAAFINSSLTSGECRDILRRAATGQYKIIYIAPERLETETFLRFAEKTEISLVAVDEAHCVSQWGQNFRPSYLKIAGFIESLPTRPVVGAFTGTATDKVKSDMIHLLRLRDTQDVTTGFDRPNLYFEVIKPGSKSSYLRKLIRKRRGKSGIIYCSTRKTVELVCEDLRRHGISAVRYHAGLDEEERRRNQDEFIYDHAEVMVATNAFGMGIDKSNVSFVIHYNMPKSLESYYQEAGRAGRDGTDADCILMFSAEDFRTARFLIQSSDMNINEELTDEERQAVYQRDKERLNKMEGYCKTDSCLRIYILEYFGQHGNGDCGNCGGCNETSASQDITTEAKQILSGVARVERKLQYGVGGMLIIGMLRGSREKRIMQLGLNELPTYGIMRDMSKKTVREYIDHLVVGGYLEMYGEYPVLRLTARAGDVLFRDKKVYLLIPEGDSEFLEVSAERAVPVEAAPTDDGLFAALKSLRTELALESNVPAYVIFSNAALINMAERKPRTNEDFLEVHGVGEVKAARYGEQFLKLIGDYIENQ